MEACFFLTPPPGETFDVERLESALAADPCTVRHPHLKDTTFIICESERMASLLEADLRNDPEADYEGQGAITVRPDYLRVWQYTTDQVIQRIKRFILPILQERRCGVVNELTLDVTDRYVQHPELLFHP